MVESNSMKTLRFLFLVFVLLRSLPVEAQLFNFQNYNVEDGIAQSQVYALYEDVLGRLWMGTRGGGISVFDGFEFKNYTTRDKLPGNYINKIQNDRYGTIWVATNGGLCYFNGNIFVEVRSDSSKNPLHILDLQLTENGKMYAAGPDGLFEIKNKNPHRLLSRKDLNNANVSCVYASNDEILIGTDRNLLRYANGKLSDLSTVSSFMKNAITRIRRSQNGTYWIGTYGDGMYGWNKDKFFRVDFHHELYRQSVLDIFVDQDNDLWIATLSAGVLHYDQETRSFLNISENEGLSNNHVRAILKDRNRNMWFGTSGGGVCHYLGKQFTNYDQKSGLGGNFIYSVFRDSKGVLWVGNSQNGVSTLDDKGFTRYDAANGFVNVKVKAIDEDKEGTIWLGTDGQGVFAYRKGRFELIDGLGAAYVKDIEHDAQGSVWIATAGSGLIHITPSGGNFIIEKMTVREGLISNRINALLFDRNGQLWYGSERDGLGYLSFGKGGQKKGYISALGKEEIRCLAQDDFGRIWVGTAANGLRIFSPNQAEKISTINEDQGLRSSNIYLLITDKEGNLIAGSEKGLDYLFFHPQGSIRQIRHYGQLDGFTGVETCQNAAWRDQNGSLWFGTINGLCRFNPAEMVSNKVAPNLMLRDVKLFYESLGSERLLANTGTAGAPLQLAYDENHLSFDFIGINLKRPEGVNYQWRLLGFDDHWSPESRDRSILYSNLNPGHYIFEVRASNEDGVWNEEPLRFEFEIATPYWQQAWFRILIVLSILILLTGIYLASVRRIRKKAFERQQKLTLEKDFLELEQKAMRLQMNPHFIFNALNSIQSLIGTGKETEARYYLAKFSRLMRQILDNSRRSSITLEEEINTLENYLLIEQFCNADRFEYRIEMDENLEKDFINIPPMLIQPFVENAIKHGMKGRSEAMGKGLIQIHFEEKNHYLVCSIEDNGIGREASARLKEESKETYHHSTGLDVTTERLTRILPEGESIEPLEIIDIYENGESLGTRVILHIPID